MKKIITVIFILISTVLVLLFLISRNDVVKYTTTKLNISESPIEVQQWISEMENNSETSTYLARSIVNDKSIIYVYIPSIIVSDTSYSYHTINISPIKKEGILIKSELSKSLIPNEILVEVKIITPMIKYVKVNNITYSIEHLPLLYQNSTIEKK